MKTELWQIGKTAFPYLDEGVRIYESRLQRYLPFQIETIPDVKNAQKMPPSQLKTREGELVLARLKTDDFLILLDERGKSYTSVEWAQFLEKELMGSHKRIVFLIGGHLDFRRNLPKSQCKSLALEHDFFPIK